jgi:hypothetical protein
MKLLSSSNSLYSSPQQYLRVAGFFKNPLTFIELLFYCDHSASRQPRPGTTR